MDLSRSWTRRLFGASGIALLVPGTVVAAFVVLGLAGGFGQIGTFRQVFAGPSLSHADGAGGGVSATSRTLAAAIAANSHVGKLGEGAVAPADGGQPGGSRGGTAHTGGVSGAPSSVSAPVSTHSNGTSGTGSSSTAPASGGTPTQSSPTPSSPTSTPTAPSPSGLVSAVSGTVQRAAGALSKATSTVAAVSGTAPAPVGPITSSVASSVGGTATKLLNGVASTSKGL